MLGKLIKYEFRATRGLMLTVYGALLAIAAAFAVVTNISGGFTMGGYMTEPSLLQSVGSMLFVAIMYLGMISLVMSLIYAIKRFRSNILGPQGYLMNTLPAAAGSKVIAKMIVSAVWTLIGYLIFAIGILSAFSPIIDYLNLTHADISVNADNIIMLIMLLMKVFKFYLMVYASMAIGYSFNNRHKLLSCASFAGLVAVNNMLNTALLEAVPLKFSALAQLILTVLTGVGVYFLTVYFLEHRLNLE